MKKVFVGLSGGVDSATSALILKEQGYDVTGVFIKIWQPEFIECTWREDRLDAMRVAAFLGIPFREIDLSNEYKKEVVDSMVADYEAGITPNPDVLCNEKIKFGSFLQWALKEGADLVATGHYAQIEEDNGTYRLLRGADRSKDQSYFVHRLTSQDLARVLFPVGSIQKSEVRAKALVAGLPVAKKHDSQGLCFVGDVSMQDFLRRYITVLKGPVVNIVGEVVGEHEGAALYTIGERHGFSIFKSQENNPYYITAIDTEKNTLIVSADRADAARASIALKELHWIGQIPVAPFESLVQTRYREEPVRARIERKGGILEATFEKKHLVSPGQSMVFYEGDICHGGAVMV